MRSSGFPDLDKAALETLRRADPLPKIPADRPDEIELAVPVESADDLFNAAVPITGRPKGAIPTSQPSEMARNRQALGIPQVQISTTISGRKSAGR
ncbi:energy transducer TonB [Novosphingobium sp.]|uniref:energy transducer TonB family protein n=1 Tax=Novosphingobium sp. TaxID=1874826 RepID=UPI00352ABECB